MFSPWSGSLANNAGTTWIPAGGSATNSQCSLTSASASSVANGSNPTVWGGYFGAYGLNLTFTVTASSTWTGIKNVYGKASNGNGSSTTGWQTLGTGSWNITAVVSSVSATPNSGNGMQQTFSFVYSDSNGASDLATAYFSFVGGCQGTMTAPPTN